MPMIECTSLNGTTKNVRIKDLNLRPAAYAITMRDANILLMRLRHTGLYHLPVSGVHKGERIKDTLKREVKEETGLEIEVGRFAHFEELFFYFEPSAKAFHGLHFFRLDFHGRTPESWTIFTDNHTFTLFWAPLADAPRIISPDQREWLEFLSKSQTITGYPYREGSQ